MSSSRPILRRKGENGPFLGRQAEIARLQKAIVARESLLIWGAPGSGKTALVEHAISALSRGVAKSCIRAAAHGSPQEILRQIVEQLEDDPLFRAKFRADTSYGASFGQWVRHQSSLRLRGLLYRAAGAGEYRIFLDECAPMTHLFVRILKELIWNQKTPVYVIAEGWTFRDLGYADSLYWNDQLRLALGPLSPVAARKLLEVCIQVHSLDRFDLEDFREDILHFSGMLPGAIVRMCAAAVDSRYHFEGRIKTKLLHVDYLMNHCEAKGISHRNAAKGETSAYGI